jgi:hypothetical protein
MTKPATATTTQLEQLATAVLWPGVRHGRKESAETLLSLMRTYAKIKRIAAPTRRRSLGGSDAFLLDLSFTELVTQAKRIGLPVLASVEKE